VGELFVRGVGICPREKCLTFSIVDPVCGFALGYLASTINARSLEAVSEWTIYALDACYRIPRIHYLAQWYRRPDTGPAIDSDGS